jgi:hypothetical protein
MKKETALSFRIAQRLKAELEKVALNEGRSLSQVCEALLAGGLEIYKKQGSQYVQRLLSRRRQDASESFQRTVPAFSLLGRRPDHGPWIVLLFFCASGLSGASHQGRGSYAGGFVVGLLFRYTTYIPQNGCCRGDICA